MIAMSNKIMTPEMAPIIIATNGSARAVDTVPIVMIFLAPKITIHSSVASLMNRLSPILICIKKRIG